MLTEEAVTRAHCNRCGKVETRSGLQRLGNQIEAFPGWVEVAHVEHDPIPGTRRLHYCPDCWLHIAPPDLLTPDERYLKEQHAHVSKPDTDMG